MARHDAEATYFTGNVFALAEATAATAADLAAIQAEEDLEHIYRARMAAARRRCGSSLDSLELAKMAGWSA